VNLGVWMSRGGWRHKRVSERRLETWNLPDLPDGFLAASGFARLYVAIEGQWRGYFVITRLLWSPSDPRAPFSLAFAPASWVAIEPLPAPPRPRSQRFTLDIPPTRR